MDKTKRHYNNYYYFFFEVTPKGHAQIDPFRYLK